MNHEDFIKLLRTQLKSVYEMSRDGKPDVKQKHRVEGLLQAGMLLGVFSKEFSEAMIEEIHQDVFGMSVQARRDSNIALEVLKETDPDSYYDTPTFERKLIRQGKKP